MIPNTIATSSTAPEFDHSKPGLVFDADSITLTGRYTDELSAYRARKIWERIFAHHFLLESKRDYTSVVTQFENSCCFFLQCTFDSACGRYAFWRLVNQQAEEVEKKLQTTNIVNMKVGRFLLGSVWDVGQNGPWVMNAKQDVGLDHGLRFLKKVMAILRRYL